MTSSNSVHPSVMRTAFQAEKDSAALQRWRILKSLLPTLDPRSQAIVLLRCQEFTLEQIGEALGLSRERVRQIEAKAYESLRASLKAMKIKGLRDI